MLYGSLTRTKSTRTRRGRLPGLDKLDGAATGDGVQDDGSEAGDAHEETKTAPELRTRDSARGDGAVSPGPADDVSCWADDDGVSETSTFFEKDNLDALRKRRLLDATARIAVLERQLAAARGDAKQERARLAALGTRLAAVEATLRLEREASRPDREALMKIAERAVDQASRMNEEASRWKRECQGLLGSVTALRAANEELNTLHRTSTAPLRTTSLRSQRSSKSSSPRSMSFPGLSLPSPRNLVRRLSERKSPPEGQPAARGAFWSSGPEEDPLPSEPSSRSALGDNMRNHQ
eukprot:CAMPEP_0119260028 /NCGR_PEP_ID=MMETSP1329-20130426/609_1 /TAXON_ID=114041 /ORGANISM="Genus nov. species nov., Strain RCC1024" /LENGTH=293 /DNA_ID=CAMNT_0007259441 /DNA_START=68 /DNA_END=946 /DNA_ORIENTATION=+